jgi:hypothetical protein
MRLRAMLSVLAVAAGLVLLPSSPAAAQPPANDDFDHAVPLAALPFQVTADTTEATRAADDPECLGEDGHTVWYALTLGSETEVALDTFGSDYDTTLSAWTGERGSLEQVACNDDTQDLQSLILFTAEAGVTYYLMVATFFDSPGGQLVLNGRVAPPPLELEITVDPSGVVNPDGSATISGVVSCSRPVEGPVVGTLRQRVAVGAFRVTPFACTGESPWRTVVLGETGTYRRGDATVVAAIEVFDPGRGEVVRDRADATIRLR